MLFVLLFIVVVLFIIHYLVQNTREAKLFNKIPGPCVIPLLGNGLDFLDTSVPLFYKGRSVSNRFGKISRFWAGPQKVLNIYDPDDIEIVLSSSKHITKGDIYRFLHPWLQDGLLTSTGDKWQSRRKILTPTFHFNILRQFCLTFVEESQKLVELLKKEVGKPETEILPFITDFTLKSICETAMGTNLENANTSVVKKYKEAIYDFGKILVKRFTTVWLYSDGIFALTPIKWKQNVIIDTMHKFTSDIISARRNTRVKTDYDNDKEDLVLGSKKRMAMLDLLLTAEDNGQINDSGIREEVDTFMFEGHDTITMALQFALMLLANHPEVQDKILAEINEVQGDSNKSITIEELNQMKYLERCIKEALRLYPSVPFMNRQLKEDLQLKNYLIPAGTLCNIHSFDLHRKASLFPNPDKFDPDRFLPENCVNRHPFAYIPFSAGPRNCIGQKYAILEEKAVIAAIVKNFKMEAVTRPDDIIFSADIVLRSENPIKVKFLLRD